MIATICKDSPINPTTSLLCCFSYPHTVPIPPVFYRSHYLFLPYGVCQLVKTQNPGSALAQPTKIITKLSDLLDGVNGLHAAVTCCSAVLALV